MLAQIVIFYFKIKNCQKVQNGFQKEVSKEGMNFKQVLKVDHACKRYPLIDEVAFIGFKTGVGPCLSVVS